MCLDIPEGNISEKISEKTLLTQKSLLTQDNENLENQPLTQTTIKTQIKTNFLKIIIKVKMKILGSLIPVIHFQKIVPHTQRVMGKSTKSQKRY